MLSLKLVITIYMICLYNWVNEMIPNPIQQPTMFVELDSSAYDWAKTPL